MHQTPEVVQLSEELSLLLRKNHWSGGAACREHETEIFFPTRGENLKRAKAICATCPVIEECREYALELSQHVYVHGVWGGTSEQQRRQILQSQGKRFTRTVTKAPD